MSRSAPSAALFDIGMTFIHPCGNVMREELERAGAAVTGDAARFELALAAAAELHHLTFPDELTRSQKVGRTWAAFLGVDPKIGETAWRGCERRADLYRTLDDEAHGVLGFLKARGVAVAAVSNSDGSLVEELDRFGILAYFDVIIDSTTVGCEKPNQQIFREALARLDRRSDEVRFVGDGLINDILGAYGVGIHDAVLFDRLGTYRDIPGIRRVRALRELQTLPWSVARPPAAA